MVKDYNIPKSKPLAFSVTIYFEEFMSPTSCRYRPTIMRNRKINCQKFLKITFYTCFISRYDFCFEVNMIVYTYFYSRVSSSS